VLFLKTGCCGDNCRSLTALLRDDKERVVAYLGG